MADYSKLSPEYISNGYYNIGGKEFMSVWTFKKKVGAPTPNLTPINGEEGKQLAQICSRVYSTTPDFGEFKEILIFPLEELKGFYAH
jgi:hypothetical protein